jgi:gliding motility associated protien GldN
MKRIGLILILAMALLPTGQLLAQSNILDGVYIKEHTPERKYIPYTYLREADVMWSKRIWRVIDMREKINHIFYYPTDNMPGRKSLMDVIMSAIMNDGTITAYEDENFEKVLTRAKVDSMFHKKRKEFVPNPDNPDEQIEKEIEEVVPYSNIKKFRVKEDWFFDKQRSVLECRIIGLCPVTQVDFAGEMVDKGLFWIYFTEARQVLASAEVYNRQNDAERRTYEDVFWKRQFSSYIYKETNVYEREIKDYMTGLDALIESERVKEDIFNLEHDLWEF